MCALLKNGIMDIIHINVLSTLILIQSVVPSFCRFFQIVGGALRETQERL